ncbi:hypothetical protein LTS10_003492 [Elasticomyces elasticus]|nr:hypothetical protein LTS10_003492 [Elasticomyces elasticus]
MADKRCPLLILPPELRNNIYDMVFEANCLNHPYININKSGYATHMHALLHVSKQVRGDTMGMWHNFNTFTLYYLTPESGLAQCNLWLDRVGASTLRCVQNLSVSFQLRCAGTVHSIEYFGVDINTRAHTKKDMVHCTGPRCHIHLPDPLALDNFCQQMYTAVNSWQLGTVMHSGTGEWQNLLRAILAVLKYSWTCTE